jgi:hypothetical protein
MTTTTNGSSTATYHLKELNNTCLHLEETVDDSGTYYHLRATSGVIVGDTFTSIADAVKYAQEDWTTPEDEEDAPHFREPLYQQDKARLVAWYEDYFEAHFPYVGDETKDYLHLVRSIGLVIGHQLSKKYKQGQPHLTVGELNPFVILNEGHDRFELMCKEFGIAQSSFWTFHQRWMRTCILDGVFTGYDADLYEENVESFISVMCNALAVPKAPTDEETTDG